MGDLEHLWCSDFEKLAKSRSRNKDERPTVIIVLENTADLSF